jgi:hypothetical protein
MTLFGQSTLTARRLVEAGGRFVSVFWDEFGLAGTGWDTHNEGQQNQHGLIQELDIALSALIIDLEEKKLLDKTGLSIGQIDVIELNEAFASQGLAVLRELGLPDDAAHVNPNGGAIALGHPLGMSGARLLITASLQLQLTGKRYALCTMCIGVGQGYAVILERV